VAIDHHQTRLFTIAGASETARTLRPYDPYHFLHHLSHRQDRELRGQREPEEPGYYSAIAAALAPARRIVLLGHGTGHSNAAAHLEGVLRAKHPEIHSRIVATKTVDLSAITEPQLLALALETLDLPGT
jgi:DNA-binding MurR/RpiR family transcriptional regulator